MTNIHLLLPYLMHSLSYNAQTQCRLYTCLFLSQLAYYIHSFHHLITLEKHVSFHRTKSFSSLLKKKRFENQISCAILVVYSTICPVIFLYIR